MDLATSRRAEVCACDFTCILRELAGVLRRKAGSTEGEIVRILKELVRVAELVSPKVTIHAIADDADNRILECAVAGNADLIVSSDYHLRKLKAYGGIAIVHPVEFRRMFGE